MIHGYARRQQQLRRRGEALSITASRSTINAPGRGTELHIPCVHDDTARAITRGKWLVPPKRWNHSSCLLCVRHTHIGRQASSESWPDSARKHRAYCTCRYLFETHTLFLLSLIPGILYLVCIITVPGRRFSLFLLLFRLLYPTRCSVAMWQSH